MNSSRSWPRQLSHVTACRAAFVYAIACVALATSASLVAQKARILGKVVARDGAPVAGAEVVLRSHGWLFHPEFGEVHEVRSTSRKNGRFRASVFPARPYSVWARLPGDAPRFTKIAENVLAGAPVSLEAEAFDRVRVALVVKGLEKWQDLGFFRFRVTSQAQNFEETYVRAADVSDPSKLSLVLPDLPGSKAFVTILDGKGRPFLTERIGYRKQEDGAGRDGVEERVWVVPPPLSVRIKTVSFEKPVAPVAGTDFVWELGTSHRRDVDFRIPLRRRVDRPLGRTNDAGILAIKIPVSKQRLWQDFIAQAQDRVLTRVLLKPYNEQDFTKAVKVEGFDRAIEVRLKRGRSIRGRVVDADGNAVAGLMLRLPQPATKWFNNRSSSWSERSPLHVRTDAEGRFRFEPVLRDQRLRFFALPDAEQRARLAPHVSARVGRALDLGGYRVGKQVTSVDVGDIRVNTRSIQVQVRKSEGPISGVQIVTFPMDRTYRAAVIDRSFSDRRGGATLLIPKGEIVVLAWHPRAGYAIREHTPDPQRKNEALVLELKDYRWASGKVVDGRGKPVVGADLSTRGETYRGPVRQHVLNVNASLRVQESDKDGRIRFPFIPEKAWSMSFVATARINKKFFESAQVEFKALDADQELEFVVNRQR